MRAILPAEFNQRVETAHSGKLIVLSEYRNRREKVLVRCSDCSHEWEAHPTPLTKGVGCPQCQYNRPRTLEEHTHAIFERHGSTVEVIDFGIYKCQCGDTFTRNSSDMLRSANGVCLNCIYLGRRLPPSSDTLGAFRKRVSGLTIRNYELYRTVIDPKGLGRSKDWNIDHLHSVHDAFYNPKGLKRPVTVEECAHPANLRMLGATYNRIKGPKSIISATILRRRIAQFEAEHGVAW